MHYFTVRGSTSQEALADMMQRYGPDACIQSHRTVRVGGVLGLFARPAVEITGYVEGRTADPAVPPPADDLPPRARAQGAGGGQSRQVAGRGHGAAGKIGRVASVRVGSDGAA